jgi:hypothetical protein
MTPPPELPCHTLYHGARELSAHTSVERCFAWAEGLEPRPEKSPAPLLAGSYGFNFTEYDTALAADAYDACEAERARREQAFPLRGAPVGALSRGRLPNGTAATESKHRGGTLVAPILASAERTGERAAHDGACGAACEEDESRGRQVERAGVRRGVWTALTCVRNLRGKSRPGMTAFDAGATARILVSLDATQESRPRRSAHDVEATDPIAAAVALASTPPVVQDASASPVEGRRLERRRPITSAVQPPPLPPPPEPWAAPIAAAAAAVPATDARQHAQLTLTYLSSYEAMGIARLRCMRGCECTPTDIDAHRGSEESGPRLSVYRTLGVALTLDVARRCVVELHVLARTRSGGHKFKLSEMALVATGAHRTEADRERDCV